MSHARIEDITDDPDEMSIDDISFGRPSNQIPAGSSAGFSSGSAMGLDPRQPEDCKGHQCLYPIYFDSKRSRAEGRRVSTKLAVANPLASVMAEGAREFARKKGVDLKAVCEMNKTHPRDWGNPGRVRILVENGKKKAEVMQFIAKFLQSKSEMLQGEKPQATVRGLKLNSVLPPESPAISGGGVTDDMLKQMMNGMGGQIPGMDALMKGPPGGGKKRV
ncbi:SRP19-domain-containing protein, partial [Piedraia hortae CBS 480.64]